MRLIMILLVLPTPPPRVLHNILHCLRKLQKSTPRTHPLEDFPRPSERPVDRNRRSLPYTHVQSVRGGGTSVTVGAVEVAVAHVVQLLHSVIIATIVAPSQQGPNRPREHVVLPHGPSVLVRTVHRGGEVQDAPPVVPRRDVDAPIEDYPADDVGVPDRAGGKIITCLCSSSVTVVVFLPMSSLRISLPRRTLILRSTLLPAAVPPVPSVSSASSETTTCFARTIFPPPSSVTLPSSDLWSPPSRIPIARPSSTITRSAFLLNRYVPPCTAAERQNA